MTRAQSVKPERERAAPERGAAPSRTQVLCHGARELPAVRVEAYNAELRSGRRFVGDRASGEAFRELLEKGRERLREMGDDPLGETPSDELSKKQLDDTLLAGDPEAAGVVQGAIEEFAAELAKVTSRFRRLKAWREVGCVVVGGGLRESRVGELAIGRASVLMKDAGHDVQLRPIHYHPDEAGLIGAVQLAPRWLFKGHDAILAIDIGGSNIRAGVVCLHLERSKDFSHAAVHESELWRHADDDPPPSRDEAVARVGDMLSRLIRDAEKAGVALAPFVGVGCPGVITAEGLIERGGQNLPGNWESSRFNLPAELSRHLPRIDGQETMIVLHNDAVVQGLSERPFMAGVERWGVLTIGTGLGNAAFTSIDDGE